MRPETRSEDRTEGASPLAFEDKAEGVERLTVRIPVSAESALCAAYFQRGGAVSAVVALHRSASIETL